MNNLFEFLGIICLLSFIIRLIIFYYLEISNNYSNFPFNKLNSEYFHAYKKLVKPQDVKWVKLSNGLLFLSGFLFCLCLVMIIFKIDKKT
jgi:hypothetical protein